MPQHVIKPMLAVLREQPFDKTGWIFEIKWDGYRAMAVKHGDTVTLTSRNGIDFTDRFSEITRALKHIKGDVVLDGEIVVLDASGKSQFGWLQRFEKTHEGLLVYETFDLLEENEKDIRLLPLLERKRRLKARLPKHRHLRFSDHVATCGTDFFRAAMQRGLEGMMAKDSMSPYREGVRSPEWVKVKTKHRQEVVVGGFTEPAGSRNYFGALLVGVYGGGQLIYAGHVGTGFDEQTLVDVYAKLKPLIKKQSPFTGVVEPNAEVHWVRPVLVCEVAFAEWTQDGKMRAPVFIGLREDKDAKEVVREL